VQLPPWYVFIIEAVFIIGSHDLFPHSAVEFFSNTTSFLPTIAQRRTLSSRWLNGAKGAKGAKGEE
jgi:hypothetical protein